MRNWCKIGRKSSQKELFTKNLKRSILNGGHCQNDALEVKKGCTQKERKGGERKGGHEAEKISHGWYCKNEASSRGKHVKIIGKKIKL
jgi:hypothetical protein